VDHPAFAQDVDTIVGRAGHRLCHLMVPKVESVDDVQAIAAARCWISRMARPHLPLHALIESPAAVHRRL
jgi:citrate lyase subunit beta/citryl-CoA lyase